MLLEGKYAQARARFNRATSAVMDIKREEFETKIEEFREKRESVIRRDEESVARCFIGQANDESADAMAFKWFGGRLTDKEKIVTREKMARDYLRP